jgi:hypothetical protein
MPENTVYFIYGILAVAVILLVLLIVALIYLQTFSKYFANQKFRVKATFDVNPDTKADGFMLTVYNNNLNDVRINGFGFIYNGERINYTERYRAAHNLAATENPIILAHGLIWLTLPVLEVEALLKARNKGGLKVKKLSVFVDDSLGMQTLSKATAILNVVKKDFKMERLALEKVHRADKRLAHKEKRRAQWHACKRKVCAIFKKKAK